MKQWNEDELRSIRRDLHKIPEIGLSEYQTHAYLLQKIKEFPQEHLEIQTWQTAIIVKIKGEAPAKTIGWRTDIDGLPIVEETGLPFASIHEGRMHACGHDFHMTIALGILQRMVRHQPTNDFVFLFQPAEENEAGGKLVYESGVLDEWLPDEIYGLHIQPTLPVGTIGTNSGTLFAGDCEMTTTFKGKGGHAAYPHLSNDMIVAATSFIQQVQTVVSRNVNPMEGAVVTIATIHGGTATNIVADEVQLAGSIRALTHEVNEVTQRRVKQIAKGIEASFDCEVVLDLDQKGYLPVVNDAATTEKFMAFMSEHSEVNLVESEPAMTAEDFGFLLSKISGTMFWLGVEDTHDLHSSHLSPNEAALMYGVEGVTDYFKWLDTAYKDS